MQLLKLPKIIAHRGASQLAPENTLSALRLAHAAGAEWVEFDVTLTQDEEVIIFHDAYLERTTNGHGKVTETPSAVIASLDAGNWFSPAFKGEKIPTLMEWLNIARELRMGINLELKVNGLRAAKILAKKVAEALDQVWDDSLPSPLISSFNKDCLHAIYITAPYLMRGLLIHRWTKNFQRFLDRYECVSLHINHRYLNEDRVKQVKRLGRKILAYTIDHSDRALQLFAMGVDSIFTNNLEVIKK